jgi:hypothetical protein
MLEDVISWWGFFAVGLGIVAFVFIVLAATAKFAKWLDKQ